MHEGQVSDFEDPAAAFAEQTESSTVSADGQTRYYVVSVRKFLLMSMLTFNLYLIAWFYQHWVHIRRFTRNDNIWPAPRALFSVFFTHALGREIESSLRRERINLQWNYSLPATVFVILTVISLFFDRVAEHFLSNTAMLIILLLLVVVCPYTLLGFQKAANVVCRDPEGATNNTLNWVNWVWLAIGVVLLLLIVLAIIFETVAPSPG